MILVAPRVKRVPSLMTRRSFGETFFVTADGNRTMVQIDTGINGLKGTIGRIAFLVSADDVISHTERDDLFEVEDVLNDYNGSATLFVGILILLTLTEFADTYTDAKLLATVRTFEDQRLAFRILCLIKGDVLVTFRAAYSFHG